MMNSSEKSVFWGWFFMIFGSVFFSGFFYAAVISKLLPPSDNAFIYAIQNDSTPPAPLEYKDTAKTSRDNWKVPLTQTSSINTRIQQAKNFAVAQAQQEGCTGNYRIFDSPFGNFLVPVLPTPAEFKE